MFSNVLLFPNVKGGTPCYMYITLHYVMYMLLVRGFYPKRLTYIQYCGQSPQEQFGVKCLAQGHNDMLTAVGLKLAIP